MAKKLFLISGKAESGKDSFYHLATEIREEDSNDAFARLSFGDEVKSVAYKAFKWDGKKDVKGRRLLQWLGDGAREYDENIWITRTIEHFGALKHGENSKVFFTDCRYPNEIELVKQYGEMWGYKVITVRVNRPNHVSKLTETQLLNTSETALDNYTFDYVLENVGTLEEYKEKVARVLNC